MTEFNQYMERTYNEIILRGQADARYIVNKAIDNGVIKGDEDHKADVLNSASNVESGRNMMDKDFIIIKNPSLKQIHVKYRDNFYYEDELILRAIIFNNDIYVSGRNGIHEDMLIHLRNKKGLVRMDLEALGYDGGIFDETDPKYMGKANHTCWQMADGVLYLSESYNKYKKDNVAVVPEKIALIQKSIDSVPSYKSMFKFDISFFKGYNF